jgi:hypothetical protein
LVDITVDEDFRIFGIFSLYIRRILISIIRRHLTVCPKRTKIGSSKILDIAEGSKRLATNYNRNSAKRVKRTRSDLFVNNKILFIFSFITISDIFRENSREKSPENENFSLHSSGGEKRDRPRSHVRFFRLVFFFTGGAAAD